MCEQWIFGVFWNKFRALGFRRGSFLWQKMVSVCKPTMVLVTFEWCDQKLFSIHAGFFPSLSTSRGHRGGGGKQCQQVVKETSDLWKSELKLTGRLMFPFNFFSSLSSLFCFGALLALQASLLFSFSNCSLFNFALSLEKNGRKDQIDCCFDHHNHSMSKHLI